MLHIHSHDNASGNTYDGTWALSRITRGTKELLYQHVQTGNIPWVFTGCDGVKITHNAIEYTFTLSQSSESDKTTIASDLQTQFRANIAPATTMTVSYDATDDEFDFDFDGVSTTFQWSDAASTFGLVMGASSDETGTTFSYSARNANTRPALLEVHIDEADNDSGNTRATLPNIYIALDDEHVRGQKIDISTATTEFTMQWYRVNVPESVVPFDLEWNLIFQ